MGSGILPCPDNHLLGVTIMKLFLGFGLVSLLASTGCAVPSGKCTTPEGGIVLGCGEDTAVPDSDTHTGDSDTDTDTSGETGDSDTHTGDTDTGPVDADADGYDSDVDCNDSDAAVHPDAAESCNGIDDNCEAGIDEGVESTWYADGDSDGYGDAAISVEACDAPVGYVADATDCNDTDFDVHPNAVESCTDAVDLNCDGSAGTADADGDGTIACEDCDDTEAAMYPGRTETCDGLDNDCDTFVDDDATDALTWYADVDGDSFGDPLNTEAACAASAGYVADSTDCDDSRSDINPGEDEQCDGSTTDENCNGLADDADPTVLESGKSHLFHDADGDAYGDPATDTLYCSSPDSTWIGDSTDCDDTNSAVNPVATEVCNDVDDDCDSSVDEAGAEGETAWYADADGDEYGDETSSVDACDAPAGYVADSSDCDDGEATVHPGATEVVADGVDQNCDGADSTAADSDSDGDPDTSDCDDSDSAVYNGATEVCNGIDDDCDLETDEFVATTYYADNDADGYGDPSTSEDDCTAPSGYVSNSNDCDDTEAAAYTGAPETCDGVDNDCNGNVDEGVSTTYYADGDGDGYGDPTSTVEGCTSPSGYVLDDTDCDDSRDWANPSFAGSEQCWSGVDADCDGVLGFGDSDCSSAGAGANLFTDPVKWNFEDPIGSGDVSGIVTVSGAAATSDCSTAAGTDDCSAMLQGPGEWTVTSDTAATSGSLVYCFFSARETAGPSVHIDSAVYRGTQVLASDYTHEAVSSWSPVVELTSTSTAPSTSGTLVLHLYVDSSDAVWVDGLVCQQVP